LRKKVTVFLISAFFILIFASCLFPASALPAVNDISNHWAEKAVETALCLGIAGGYPEEFFGPDQPVTRAEFVKLIVAASGVSPLKNNLVSTFEDVGRTHWAYPFVEAAAAAGIVKAGAGPERYFEPDRTITRDEMAAMAGRLLVWANQPGRLVDSDDNYINRPALMRGSGLFYGYPDGTFGEDNGATRAEACVVILRLKDRLLAAETERERAWISSAQNPEGYLFLAGGRPDVIPYFTNLAGLALCGDPQSFGAIKKYLEWSFSRLNYPDRWGLNGTIYDYRLEGGVLVNVYDYDSADSYAATLLTLAAVYQENSRDLNFISEHYRELSTVAELIIALQDSDGLVWAKPDLKVKYLMDNCECYRGLKDWARLLAGLGYNELSGIYDHKAETVKNSILERFWDDDAYCFAWAVDRDSNRHLPVRGRSYPGLFAQVYPVTFEVIPPESEQAKLAYQKLNSELPGWPELAVGDPFPWSILGYGASLMGDLPRACVFLHNCRSSYITVGREYPWSTFESAFYARACETIRGKIKEGLS